MGATATVASPMTAAATLEPLYYRDNFLRMCATVEDQYGDLLTAAEAGFLVRLQRASRPAQCLYVRLVSRVGPRFRVSALVYPEIPSVDRALQELASIGLLVFCQGLAPEDAGSVFTVPELRRAFPLLANQSAGRRKSALLAAIAAQGLSPTALLERLAGRDGDQVVMPLGTETVALLQLLFFGNRRQGLTEFVLSDLGVACYYPYPVNREQRLFPDRAALDEYLDYAALSDRFDAWQADADAPADDLLQLGDEMVGLQPVGAATRERWHRLCNRVARCLERAGETDLALVLYARSPLHPSRERRARVLERSGDWVRALGLCGEIVAAPRCEAERDAARRMMPRLQRRLGVRPGCRRERFPVDTVALPRGDLGVERAAAAQLQESWAAVHYVENTLMNGLFGLAFWEQIFAPVPGVFHNPYQSIPSDMYTADFRRRRRPQLESRLGALREASLAQELLSAWHRYHPYQCRWLSWRRLSPEMLAQALAVIPAAHLLAIWERMLFDPGENRRGFPDLIALGHAPGDYRLVEVKGPGDSLQDQQKRWLRFFMEQGIDARVLKVEWLDD